MKVLSALQPDRVGRLTANFRNSDNGPDGPVLEFFYPEFDQITAGLAGTPGL